MTNLEARAAITPKSTDLQCRRCKAWVGPDERVDDGEKLNPPVLCHACDALRTAQTWARIIKEQGMKARHGNVVEIFRFHADQEWGVLGALLSPDGDMWSSECWRPDGTYSGAQESMADLMVDFEFDDEVKR